MRVRSRASVPEGTSAGSTTPEKPVTIGSPGWNTGSAARAPAAPRVSEKPSAASNAADELIAPLRPKTDTMASPLPVSSQARAPQQRAPAALVIAHSIVNISQYLMTACIHLRPNQLRAFLDLAVEMT